MSDQAAYQPATKIFELGDGCYDPVQAAPFPRHELRFRNDRWANEVGLGHLDNPGWIRHFAEFEPLPQNLPEPLALRYHGHQFMSYNPRLGDGRGFLYAQLYGPSGRLLDLGTKGSGTTPYSRGGDGRLTLKGGVREVLATEMLEALGVNTSKTFSLVETGEQLQRNDEPSPTRSAVMVRLNHSHIRFGTFQRHAYEKNRDQLATILDYATRHLVPEAKRVDTGETAKAFLAAVAERVGKTCAQWMVAGFVHGVLNTDNMNITGESFDYGPYRFAPHYDLDFTAAYFDHSGLYAYGRQPHAVLWNIEQLANALVLLGVDEPALHAAAKRYQNAFIGGVREQFIKRLGIRPQGEDPDGVLIDATYAFLGDTKLPLDRFFFDWYGGGIRHDQATQGPTGEAYRSPEFAEVARLLKAREPHNPKALEHPYFAEQAPCSMLIDEIEAIWAAIDSCDDWTPFEHKIAATRRFGEAIAAP